MTRKAKSAGLTGTLLTVLVTTPAYAHHEGTVGSVLWHAVQHAVANAGVVLVLLAVGFVILRRTWRSLI